MKRKWRGGGRGRKRSETDEERSLSEKVPPAKRTNIPNAYTSKQTTAQKKKRTKRERGGRGEREGVSLPRRNHSFCLGRSVGE